MSNIGYFSTSQLVKFTSKHLKNKSKKIKYKINVFNDCKNYLVSYNGNLEGKIIIKFEILDNENAVIIDIIGLIQNENNLSIMIITLQYIYKVFYKSVYIKDLFYNSCENCIQRINIDKFIFSIDPKGCNDIDDALSLEESNNYYIVSVYIAQPISYLNLDLIRDYSKKAFSTLYNEPYLKNKNLWGDLITFESSLLEDKIRNVYVIIFYINKLNYSFEKIEHYPAKIKNKLTTNYDDCLKYDIINKLFNITCKLSDKVKDTHELVSYWMVKTNNFIGNKFNLPYRVISLKENLLDYSNLDDDIKDIFTNKLADNAHYSLTDNYHAILNTYKYTHMTSPIRRIIDTINHWSITYNVNFEELNINLDDINNFEKNTKKYHNKIKLLNNIETLEYDTDYFYDGWIYKNNWKECLEKKNCIKITVFFKEIGFQRVELWNKKFNYLLNNNDYDKFNNINFGKKYQFLIQKKKGFLPNEKIFIKMI